MSSDTIRALRRESKIKVSTPDFLDGNNAGDDGGDASRSSYFDLGERANEPASASEELLWKVEFNSALDQLSAVERRTISIRFGLMDGLPRFINYNFE